MSSTTSLGNLSPSFLPVTVALDTPRPLALVSPPSRALASASRPPRVSSDGCAAREDDSPPCVDTRSFTALASAENARGIVTARTDSLDRAARERNRAAADDMARGRVNRGDARPDASPRSSSSLRGRRFARARRHRLRVDANDRAPPSRASVGRGRRGAGVRSREFRGAASPPRARARVGKKGAVRGERGRRVMIHRYKYY